MIKIAVSGSKGRMGSSLIRLIEDDSKLELSGAFDQGDDARAAIKDCDVLIEFTMPESTVKNLSIACELGKALVIGTTGLDEKMLALIKKASSKVPIVFSPNMAVGVNLLFKLVEEAARALDDTFTFSVSETHHIHKKDSPSGTAKRLQGIIAGSRGVEPGQVRVEAQRKGEVVGDHIVVLDGKEERLELVHHAKSRDVFARGALVAAKFVAGKKKGLYGMDEVLNMVAKERVG
ncbi:MAG: 4-hydroxy-tetrahydrodipicolinate reductase [Candidatus Omnitrophota bacterium]